MNTVDSAELIFIVECGISTQNDLTLGEVILTHGGPFSLATQKKSRASILLLTLHDRQAKGAEPFLELGDAGGLVGRDGDGARPCLSSGHQSLLDI